MAGIISSGIGSGLDIGSLVSQLVAAEGQPAKQRLVQQETRFQAKLSAYGSLKSALEAFQGASEKLQDADILNARKIKIGNEDAISASVTKDAVPANYTLEVVALAQTERLTSSAFADAETAIGTGTLSLSIGADSFDVVIDETNNTLAGIRDAVNGASDNTGVQATIVNAEGGSYLIFSGAKTGAENSLTITQTGGDGGLSSIAYDPDNAITNLSLSQAASDANIKINSFDIFSDTNVFEDAVDGITFTALETTDGDSFSADVSFDTATVKSSVQSFVSSYNALFSTIDNLSAYDAETKQAGALQGDSALRSVANLIRRELGSSVSGVDEGLNTLSELGITLDVEGRLELDSDKLDTLLASDFVSVGNLFSATDGYGAKLTGVLDSFLDSDGLLQTRTEGLESSIERLSGQNEALDRRLVSLEARLLRQFNGLDSLISQLNTTSNFLAAQLENIPSPGSNNR